MGVNVIEVPEAPRIPGLVFREFAGEEDYPAIVGVLNESMGYRVVEKSIIFRKTID